MPSRNTTRGLSDPHEEFLAQVLGGRRTVNSGAHPNDPADGRNGRDQAYAFAWDGKATRSASASVSLSTWDKLLDDAHGLRPMLALRFYGPEQRLRVVRDLAVVDMHDLVEILEVARRHA